MTICEVCRCGISDPIDVECPYCGTLGGTRCGCDGKRVWAAHVAASPECETRNRAWREKWGHVRRGAA